MTTNTAAVLPPSRIDPRQVANTLKITVNFNDPGIATGLAFANSLPKGAFILSTYVEIVTAFNAGTTNTLTVGTVSTAYNNIIDGSATAGTGLVGNATTSLAAGSRVPVTASIGRALTAAADVTPYVKYVQTGGAATTGQAIVVILYEGGWLS